MTKFLDTLLVCSNKDELPENTYIGQLAFVRDEESIYLKSDITGWFRLTKKVVDNSVPTPVNLYSAKVGKHGWNEIEKYLKENVLKEKEEYPRYDYKVKSTDYNVISYVNAVQKTDSSKPNALRLIDACASEERSNISNRVDSELFKQIKKMLDDKEDIKAIDKIKDKYVDAIVNKSRNKDLRTIRNDINKSKKLGRVLDKVKSDGHTTLLTVEPQNFIDIFNGIGKRKKNKKYWYKNKKNRYATTNKETSNKDKQTYSEKEVSQASKN